MFEVLPLLLLLYTCASTIIYWNRLIHDRDISSFALYTQTHHCVLSVTSLTYLYIYWSITVLGCLFVGLYSRRTNHRKCRFHRHSNAWFCSQEVVWTKRCQRSQSTHWHWHQRIVILWINWLTDWLWWLQHSQSLANRQKSECESGK